MILLPAVVPEIPGPLGLQVIGGFDLSPHFNVKDSDSGGESNGERLDPCISNRC